MDRRNFFGTSLATCGGIALGLLGIRGAPTKAKPALKDYDHTHPLPPAFYPGDIVSFKDEPDSRGAVFLCSGTGVAAQFWLCRARSSGYVHNVMMDTSGLVLVRTADEDMKHFKRMGRMTPPECKAYKEEVNW